VFLTAASFTAYYHGAARALADAARPAWLWTAPFVLLLARLFQLHLRGAGGKWRAARFLAWIVRPAGAGLVLLALGYVTAFFFDLGLEGRFPYTDRVSRISVASSLGSSLLIAAVLAGLIRTLRRRAARIAACVLTAAFFAVCFLYSFVLERDYVDDWQEQRRDASRILALTPDAHADSILILRVPFAPPGFQRLPAIGIDKAGFDEIFLFLYRGAPRPKLFIVVSDEWRGYLKKQADGSMAWTAPLFPGRWYPARGSYRPGRFIVLEKKPSGEIVRKSDSIVIEGVQIVAPVADARAHAAGAQTPRLATVGGVEVRAPFTAETAGSG
jgi:hypothetical protein